MLINEKKIMEQFLIQHYQIYLHEECDVGRRYITIAMASLVRRIMEVVHSGKLRRSTQPNAARWLHRAYTFVHALCH